MDRIDTVGGGRPVILGYHGIGTVQSEHDPIGLYVRPEALVDQVRRLQRRGYEFLKMREFADLLVANETPPRGVVALTFDDGTEDQATVLPGVLEELGVPGTVYPCPGLAGTPYRWALDESGIRFMTESQLIELATHPLIEIGSHTSEHRELDQADAHMALAEMAGCKQTLESLLGIEVVSFCYPRCAYSSAARDAGPLAGYTSAVTCGRRGSWNRFELKREVFHSYDGPLVVRFKLIGLYAGLGGSLAARVVRRIAIVTDRVIGLVSSRFS